MNLTLAPVSHGLPLRFPWLRRLIAFADSRLRPSDAAGPDDPDTNFPDTIPVKDSRFETEVLLGAGLDGNDPAIHEMSPDQRYYYRLAKRKLAQAGFTPRNHPGTSRPQ